jgi:flagellar biosynthesis protein FliR
MINISTGQLETWLTEFFWPFVRIGACIMVAPLFGAQVVPPRMRLFLAGAITVIVAPLVAEPTGIAPISIPGVIVTLQQVLIGVAVGFTFQLVFDALALGGQLISNSMGLSFAFNVDPLRGASTPVLGQLYMMLVSLTFLALNGHLAIIEAMTEGFKTLPVGEVGLGSQQLWAVTHWGTQLFSGALSVALPGMTALIVVNLAFGTMSRAAPTLNLFAVGFPVTLIFGLVIVYAGLPAVQSTFVESFRQALAMVGSLLAAGN